MFRPANDNWLVQARGLTWGDILMLAMFNVAGFPLLHVLQG